MVFNTNISRRSFLKMASFIGAKGLLSYQSLYAEPRNFETTYHTLSSAKISSPFRFVHLTDLHLDSSSAQDSVPNLVNTLEPDLVLMSGDYINSVQADKTLLSKLDTYMQQLKPKHGIYASLGNWDTKKETKLFKDSPVTVLRDSYVQKDLYDTTLTLVGMDFYNTSSLEHVLGDLDSSTFNILLNHSPDDIYSVADIGTIDLYLAGHTHGGQVCIPFLGYASSDVADLDYGALPLRVPSRFGTSFASGSFLVDDTLLYVNRGLGMTKAFFLPIRFFCKPEIAVFDLLPHT